MSKQWLAFIDDNSFVLAKVSVRRKSVIKILSLQNFNLEVSCGEGNDSIYDCADLKNWFHKQRVPVDELKIVVSSPGLIIRTVSLPEAPAGDLEELLTNQLEQYFSIDISQYIVDYKILNKFKENDRPMQRVLLAAFPRTRLERLWLLCQELGFQPQVIDISADCLARIYGKLTQDDIAVAAFYSDKVEFLFLEKGVYFLYSDLEINIKEIVSRRTVVTVEEHLEPRQNAGQIAGEEFFDLRMNPFPPESKPITEYTLEDLFIPQENLVSLNLKLPLEASQKSEHSLKPVISALAELLNFYEAHHNGNSVHQIYLTGEYCMIENLREIIRENFGIETVIGFPNAWKPHFSGRCKNIAADWQKYGCLYGLALREEA